MEGHCFQRYIVFSGSRFVVGTLSVQLLLQFKAGPFEAVQVV